MKLSELERTLGHNFKDIDLLERALTHRSWAHENSNGAPEREIALRENESMEFVGDSVLGLVVAEHLFLKNPSFAEGELTLMKHRLVSTKTLAKIGAELSLGDHLRMGRGEEKTGGRAKPAILADTVEAVIAAVFFDAGYVAARDFIERVFAAELERATPEGSVDYKSLLQERLQSRQLSAPEYRVVRTEGAPHERTFYVEAVWEGGRAEGEGTSIKSAEMRAACEALEMLDDDNKAKLNG
jgi:ribonuclease-3